MPLEVSMAHRFGADFWDVRSPAIQPSSAGSTTNEYVATCGSLSPMNVPVTPPSTFTVRQAPFRHLSQIFGTPPIISMSIQLSICPGVQSIPITGLISAYAPCRKQSPPPCRTNPVHPQSTFAVFRRGRRAHSTTTSFTSTIVGLQVLCISL